MTMNAETDRSVVRSVSETYGRLALQLRELRLHGVEVRQVFRRGRLLAVLNHAGFIDDERARAAALPIPARSSSRTS
jgi:hypothetical protein